VADLNNALERSGRARAASEHESNLQIAAQRGVLADREAAFERLRQELTDVRAQLDYMLNSVSWRLTASLRVVRGHLRFPSPQTGKRSARRPSGTSFGRDEEAAEVLALSQVDLYREAITDHLPTPRAFSVLYLDGMGRGFQSPRYRIDNMREALARVGIG